MPNLIVGPLLRYVGETEATVWVETDAACEVKVLGCAARTFHVAGHHYALVHVTGLQPRQAYEYQVTLDGSQRWPEAGSGWPPSVIRTIDAHGPVRLAFGSCRVSVPHAPPYSLPKDVDKRGREVDALYALAHRMRRQPRETWPHVLLLLGDQVYADEVSPGALEFIRSRRSPDEPPGEEVANFEEYTRLYWDSWRDPTLRWLLSTVSSAMIFDDHDVHDDWNISSVWVRQMRAKPWWDERIAGGFMSYWVYQHLGNLAPHELRENPLYRRVTEVMDAATLLREFALRADRENEGTRWSYCRDIGATRLIVMDSRAGRVLKDGRRYMVDEREWEWIKRHVTGDFDHLLLGTSIPVLLGQGMHHLEEWNEAVCNGAWGRFAARLGEKVRQTLDLEHWAAFGESFTSLTHLIRSVACGEHGKPPASIVALSGDVHHAYLARVSFRGAAEARSVVYQAVCSPFRNPLNARERQMIRLGWTRPAQVISRGLARSVGVRHPEISWRLAHEGLWFDNQVATLDIDGREARLQIEKTGPYEPDRPQLHRVYEYRLA